jgi:hypothetical protein
VRRGGILGRRAVRSRNQRSSVDSNRP